MAWTSSALRAITHVAAENIYWITPHAMRAPPPPNGAG